MIIDTSALIAIALLEPGFERLLNAGLTGRPRVPAPVLVEFERVVSRRLSTVAASRARAILARLIVEGAEVTPFLEVDGMAAVAANEAFGTGNGRGGTLNQLDLMVYAVARRMKLPILCTGTDFVATDAVIHPASRTS